MQRNDYLLASDDALIAQCDIDRYRASGPGGQHRNKTESAVRLRHRPTGIAAVGTESRSQAENKLHAVRRLRAAIAVGVREPVAAISERLRALVASGTSQVGAKARRTGEYWAAMAELLDILVDSQLEMGTAAQRLGITTGALSKLVLHDERVARAANELRRARGLRGLR